MKNIIIIIFLVLKYDKAEGINVIDMDDILAVDYMPGSLLMLENPEKSTKLFNSTIEDNFTNRNSTDGSFNKAYNMMGFHRTMMNEYLCRNYVAEEILSDMTTSRMRRRLGDPAPQNAKLIKPNFALSVKNHLLEDEGSSNYKDWLKKSTTLEDIYRHYDKIENRESSDRIDMNEDKTENDDANEEFDGHVTGFAYQQPHSHRSPSKLGHSDTSATGYPYSGVGGYSYQGGGGGPYGFTEGGHSSYGTGVGIGHPNYGSGSGQSTFGSGSGHGSHGFGSENEHVPKYHGSHYSGGGEHSDKEYDLANLFDIALTALAYLSFGIFIIHVIMCISMAHGNNTTTMASMMMPMSMSPTGDDGTGGTGGDNTDMGDDGMGDGTIETGNGETSMGVTGNDDMGIDNTGDDITIRFKRSMPTIMHPDNRALNELARKILTSIEAASIAKQDDGVCLRKALCNNNKYARNLTDNQKYWFPVWSLGMSWLSGKIIQSVPWATSMLDSLKASVLGLGNANCEIIYQECDLKKEKFKNRRRRK